ncbi:unnamed protein product [Arctia plantaginis]|uniref:Uncharacterized protein n=1 Tax=Arctia plantaginis TaxID=874455 RepID=A0A8S0ZR19_ARCPL|nr:unnamed protein product [Arctia plantaginis]
MGKRKKSCTGDVELKIKDEKIKPSLFGETPYKTIPKKTKKLTNFKNSLEHKLVAEKNGNVDESKPIQLSTKQSYDISKTDRDLVNNHFTAKVSEDSNLLISSQYHIAKVKRKNKNGEIRQNKKIKFTDDEPVEVDSQNTQLRKMKDTKLLQEDDVKDEDIDKFCDELTEEDNKQYENWIELLEAKLSSNKKKLK